MLDRHLIFTEKDRDIIKHDIVTRGAAQSNRRVKLSYKAETLLIDPRSGHYRPSIEECEGIGRASVQGCRLYKG